MMKNDTRTSRPAMRLVLDRETAARRAVEAALRWDADKRIVGEYGQKAADLLSPRRRRKLATTLRVLYAIYEYRTLARRPMNIGLQRCEQCVLDLIGDALGKRLPYSTVWAWSDALIRSGFDNLIDWRGRPVGTGRAIDADLWRAFRRMIRKGTSIRAAWRACDAWASREGRAWPSLRTAQIRARENGLRPQRRAARGIA